MAAKGAVSRATAIAERGGGDDASVRDVEYIRMFAKVAQVQFQAVLDALNEQVSRLGEVPTATGPSKSDEETWSSDRSAAGVRVPGSPG